MVHTRPLVSVVVGCNRYSLGYSPAAPQHARGSPGEVNPLLVGAFEGQPVAAWGLDEQAPVGPAGTGVVGFEFEADARRAASLHGGLDVADADLPGQHARWVVVGRGFLDAEMHRLRSEADEIGVLRALIDDR